jgi:hypothetical protein
MDIIEVYRDSLIKNGFREDFIKNLSPFGICSLYELWDVEDEDEQEMNVKMFLDEYGFTENEAMW